MTWRRDRSWVACLSAAVKTYNHTPSPSLDGLSPYQANKSQYTGRLQSFFLKRRYEKHRSQQKKGPLYSKGQHVKHLVKNEKFRRRGDHQRFSKDVFEIAKVISSAPYTYKLKRVGSSQVLPETWYSQQLVAVINSKTLESSVTAKLVLDILESRKFPIKFLRNGKVVEHEMRYLVLDSDDKKEFMTKQDILENYDNGNDMFSKFNRK